MINFFSLFFFFFTKANVPQNFENFVSSNQFQLYANEIVRKTQFLFVLQFLKQNLEAQVVKWSKHSGRVNENSSIKTRALAFR